MLAQSASLAHGLTTQCPPVHAKLGPHSAAFWHAGTHVPRFPPAGHTHGPPGPWLVTRDEVSDPGRLQLRTWVNGVLKQDASTSAMIFGVGALIEYVSQAFTLEPGDVIFTGTPAGVGSTRTPREWLKPGDVVRVEITGLGVLENLVADEPAGRPG